MRRRSAASWGVSKAWGGGTAARDSAASGIVAAAKPDATMVRRLSAGAPSLLCRLPTDFDPCGFASLEFRRNGRACSSRQLRSIAAPHQNLALAHVVGRADDALSFHPFDDSRGWKLRASSARPTTWASARYWCGAAIDRNCRDEQARPFLRNSSEAKPHGSKSVGNRHSRDGAPALSRRTIVASGLAAATIPLAALSRAAVPPPQALLTPQDAADLRRIAAYLNGVHTMTARFRQISSGGGIASGSLWLARPGRMRFEYDLPSPILLIADQFYVYYVDKQLAEMSKVGLKSTPAWFLLRDPIT